jgi:hypothetical protein
MSRRTGRIAAAALAVLAVVSLPACGADSSSPSGQETFVSPTPSTPTPSDPTSDPTSAPSSGTPTGGASSRPPSASPAEGPAAAVSDLAKRLGVDPGDVSVVSAEEVTWSDASIGCPKPGMMYAQVLTEGSRIVLEADGKRYEYHAATGKAPFYCEHPKRPVR